MSPGAVAKKEKAAFPTYVMHLLKLMALEIAVMSGFAECPNDFCTVHAFLAQEKKMILSVWNVMKFDKSSSDVMD
ncbi:hypothetical protein CEXT_603141 [Caerostris extrusa]|uniref:Uncharacterized protein n=1 Tax=Caerostris extrusa TaxID=172846 RepID=A0AAV4SMR9_CAEEX|nr:hypothetical protein CEXT_603141 [Caerostris extrusa]